MNLAQFIAHHARYKGSRTAVETGDLTLNYAKFGDAARRFATRLRQAGIVPGDVVGVRMRDTPSHLAALVGIMHVGGVILPLDWRAAPAEAGRALARFQPKVTISDSSRGLPDGTPTIQAKATLDVEPDPSDPEPLDNHALVYGLTSGTTGEPKAIVLTHEQMFGRTVTLALEGVITGGDRLLAQMPLAYSAGRVVLVSALTLGATVTMLPGLFEPAELVRFVRERKVTALMLSPNVGRQLLALADYGGRLLPDLRVLILGGAKLQPEERSALRSRLAPTVVDYYGSTGGGPTTIIANDEDGREPTAMGRPMAGIEVAAVDEDGRTLPVGETGVVRVRGIGVSTGFAGGAAPGDEGFRDGWYYPGDLGSIDARGMLHLHGRASDLIKRGGIMVHAQEVEQALRRHPAVSDAAVVGAPSVELGQEVVAFVMLGADADAKELIRHCRAELAPAKVPARITVVAELPRNASGKVVKAELLKRLA